MTLSQLRTYVFARDRECVAAKLGFEHVCRNAYGEPHRADETWRLSLEHVRMPTERVPYGGGAMGAPKPPDDPMHTVALCYGLNLRPPSEKLREALRDYLARLYSGA